MRYLDPKNDIAFKKIFGTHKDLCISLLNALLPLPDGGKIDSIEYNPTELLPERVLGKNSVVDVKCTDQKGRVFLVEMQMFWTEAFVQRFIYNSAKAYSQQIEKGGTYKTLCPVYSLCILNDVFIKKDFLRDTFQHIFQFRHHTFPEFKFDDIVLVFIELPKFKTDNRLLGKMTHLWLEFLTSIRQGDEDVAPELLENAETAKALDILQIGSFSKQELEAYEAYRDAVMYNEILIDGKVEDRVNERIDEIMQKGIQEGMEKGIQEGMEKGIQEGMEKGIDKGKVMGRAEGLKEGLAEGRSQRNIEIAKNMLANGFDRDTILKITGVDIGINK